MEPKDAWNQVLLQGEVFEMDALRRTPAGIPVLGFQIRHRSRQCEAELLREVEVEIQAKALGTAAELLAVAPLGSVVRITGFLARKSARSAQPVLHVNSIEFVEGIQHGFQAQVQAQGQERA